MVGQFCDAAVVCQFGDAAVVCQFGNISHEIPIILPTLVTDKLL